MKTLILIVASFVLSTSMALAVVITTTVQGTAGPWQFNGGLNSVYQYGFGGNTSPTVVSASQGFNFSAGLSLTVSYASGLVSIGPGAPGFWPYTDANGSAQGAFGDQVEPSTYMNPALGPYYMGEMVATFANGSGQIVGTPFAIGNLGTFVIPTGATQLQLGVNDTLFGDNDGSWNIQISQVPEPTTWSLLALGVGTLLGSRRLRRSA